MSSTLWIEAIPKIITYSINHVTIKVERLELGQKALVCVNFYDETHTMRYQTSLWMEGDDYQKWQTDEYVYSWVCQKLELTPLATTF